MSVSSIKKQIRNEINDNALVALALLVAQSDPVEKELITQRIINLISTQRFCPPQYKTHISRCTIIDVRLVIYSLSVYYEK